MFIMEVEIWAPPTVSTDNIAKKLNEWMRTHPNKPPFQRFLQDYISSEWPVFWHLKIVHKLEIDTQNRFAYEMETVQRVEDKCSICHSSLECGTETLDCGHSFHTMCVHMWFRYKSTCPLCRAQSR